MTFIYSFLIYCSLILAACNSGFEVAHPKKVTGLPIGQSGEAPTVPANSALTEMVSKSASQYVGAGLIANSEDQKFPSLVIGIITTKTKQLQFFGLTPEGKVPTEGSIYPLSSISKMITGLLLARGVANGDFKIPYKAKEFLPAALASHVGERTLGMLVSHYAAYRAKPGNLDYSNKLAPAANYTNEQLAKCLSDPSCSVTNYPIGSNYLYSDLGIGILGLALVNFYKSASYEDLFRTKLANDLGLSNTSAQLEYFKQSENIVGGMTLLNERVPPATMGALVAAGGILSNGQDMLKILDLVVNPKANWQSTINVATTLIQPGIAFSIDQVNREGIELFSKSGEQAGYSSIIMWNKVNRSGVFILGNRGMNSKALAKLAITLNKSIVDFAF